VMFGGEREGLIDVTLGIDDSGGAAVGVGHEIRRVGEALQVELLEEQRHLSA